jgi:hypothetical protein
MTPEEQRAKEMEYALGWLRNNDVNYGCLDMDEQTVATAQKILSMVPFALERNPMEMAVTMEGALDWLSSNGASMNFRIDDPSQAFTRRTAATGAGLAQSLLKPIKWNTLTW